jgi:glycosyltransferase involved in cell wall biosynthesis
MTTTPVTDCRPPLPASGARPLNVVMVDEELPYPPTSGKRLRTFNLTMRLAARHRITYICHRNNDPDEARRAAAFFADNGVAPVVVDRPVPPRSGMRFYARLALNLLSSLPYTVASHTSRVLQRTLVEHARSQPVDLWHCEWTPYAEALRAVEGPKVVVAHNVESVIWQRYFETEGNICKRWYIRRQWQKFEQFERRALGAATRTIAVSDTDADILARHFGLTLIDVVENGVDTTYFHPSSRRRDPARLLFLGSLDWRPNLDGVSLLLDRVFPAVRAVEPAATLRLVGRNPPDWLRRRAAAMPGVELHASVPDVRPYLADCGMMVVPLRVAGGSRLKILEALASGVPVVSTRIGAEGLCLEPGRHLTVVEDMEALVPAILAGIRHPGTLLRQAELGREEVLRHHDWDALAEKMDRVWRDTAGAGSAEWRRAA